MFKKSKTNWYWQALKALLFCQILFSISRSFMKTAQLGLGLNPKKEKKKKKKGKKDTIDLVFELLFS